MRIVLGIFLLVSTLLLFGESFLSAEQPSFIASKSIIPDLPAEQQYSKKAIAWADSLMKKMSVDEKVGQLFMISAYSNRDTTHEKEIADAIQNYHIGGIIFFQGGPVRQARLTNKYQSLAKIPLYVAMDAEWGLSMRIDSTVRYPKQMALGAVQNDTLIEKMGVYIGKECKRLGVHINFGPVVDVNNNSANPVINIRSFGENKDKVVKKALAYYKGMKKENVMACVKHFPGHGDTETDSHLGLPLITHSKDRLDSLELYPFKKLFEANVPSVMVGHMSIPSLDETPNTSSVFSKKIVTELLQQRMRFKGLIFTDALGMQGALTTYERGEVEVRAFEAGNDVLLCPDSLELAFNSLKTAVTEGRISKERLDYSVKAILLAKYSNGLYKKQHVKEENLVADLNDNTHKVNAKLLTEKSLTLLKNNKDILPLKRLDTLTIAVVSIGDSLDNTFLRSVERYSPVKKIAVGKYYTGNILDSVAGNDLVIIGMHYSAQQAQRNYLVTEPMLNTLKALQTKKHVLVTMGNAYFIDKLNTGAEEALMLTYENTENAQDLAGEALFGGATVTGKLPVTINTTYTSGMGISLTKLIRFKYVLPEELGIANVKLARADSIAQSGVDEGAYPGCVVLCAKDGKVFYQKAFGYHTFDKKRKVKITDIYDLASVSKVSGTLTSLMKLTDEKKFSVDDKLGKYLPDVIDSSSAYAKIVIKQMLTHQAGLKDWIPFFLLVYDKKTGTYDPKIFRTKPEKGFTRIHDNLYILSTYEDTIFNYILKKSPLSPNKTYKYSDLGYYFLKRAILKITGKPLDQYAYENFYKPLGLTTMGYKPRERFSIDRIPPTEDDHQFRNALVHGDVHDQGAAMVGGVGGHAGLFANANDVGVLFQMMMNYGTYGGERYIKETTLREWSKCQFCANGNRRGIGFDRPTMTGKGPT
ncbi:MAG TPA: glycoside hydrolase family 3 N-terminal domain-containing protein, partial [Flavobacteriales bacterium]|nr:glycoside hydrolase family 3 N-terminal domain-containing protein [Flavobacteriales bacterium]